ncbi:hypothetical protein BJ742DRAFT_575009 [Cladochytrium replicatum]|nr:hypothetical protein BJ742DRAFT_575009 [Cladochytrium replicatum]
MEAFTVLVWARITLKIIVIDTEASREELMRWISRVMTWLTAFVCVAIAPLFILRAAWYKFEDPWWYNTMMFFYNLVMLPWYPLFAATVIVFATKLTNLLEESMKTLTTSSFSACKPGGSSIPGTGSHCQKLENDVPSTSVGSRRKILAVTKKIRLVAILVCVDKLGFALSYTTFVVYGGMTMYEPELGMAAYFSYIAMNCLIVFWGCGLFVGCAWYHLRVDNSSDDTMPSTDEVLRRDTVTRESHSPSFRSKSCLVKAPVHAHIHEVIEMQRSPQGH